MKSGGASEARRSVPNFGSAGRSAGRENLPDPQTAGMEQHMKIAGFPWLQQEYDRRRRRTRTRTRGRTRTRTRTGH
jgi:hypothetical protein